MAPSTKLALANALKAQLQKRFLDDITVKGLVEACEVNRQTFYYHFQDIYDLLCWLLEHEAERALEGTACWQDALLAMFRYAQDNHLVIHHIYCSGGREYLEAQIRRVSRAVVAANLEPAASRLSLSREDREFLTDLFMYAVSGMMLGWFAGEMREEPEDIVERLSRLMDGAARQAAERFAMEEPVV